MKLPVVLLLFLLFIHLLELNAPRSPASLGALARQTATGTTDNKPVTVEARRTLLKQLEDAAGVALNAGQTLDAARNLHRIGRLHMLLNDPQSALASHLRALELLRQSPDPQIEIDNLNGSADAYLNLPHSDDPNAPNNSVLAQSALDKALTLSQDVRYTLGEAQTLLTLSELQNTRNHVTGLLTAQKALALWKSRDDKDGIARTYFQIGTCYLAQNLLDDAIANFTEALKLWRGLNESAQQAKTLISLGFTEYRKPDWQAGFRYLTEAYSLLDERAEPMQMGRIAAGLGASFIENGSPELAVGQYQRALDYYRQTQHPGSIVYAAYGLGRSYFLAGDLDQATTYFQEALEVAKKEPPLTSAMVLEYVGRVHIERGEYAAALKTFESVFESYTDAENPKEAARVRALIGQAYDRQGMFGRAKVNYEEALKSFTSLSDRVSQAAIYYALGELEMKQKHYDSANDYLKKSIDVTEDMRRISTSQDLMAAFSASVQDRYDAYIECLMEQNEQRASGKFAIKAFETSELSRARTLADMLLAFQANLAPGVDPQLAARQRELRQALRNKENDKIELLSKTVTQDQVKAFEEETARLESEYRQVNEAIRSRFPSYDELSRPTAWDLQHIQEKIPDDDAVLLEYSLGARNSYAWTITRNEFKSYKLPPQNVIKEAVQRVYPLLSTAPAPGAENELAQATAKLSQLVLAPVAAALNKQRIIVVADGALNYVPFQLLQASPDAKEPLISKYEVINVPSASILGQLRQEKQQRRPRSKILAVFGDPAFDSNYAQLKDSTAADSVAALSERGPRALRNVEINADTFDPATIQPLAYSKFELKNVSEIAGPKTFVASGFNASRQVLETMDLSKYSILHFATHGLLDPRNPQRSGFFLSTVDAGGQRQDGFITMQDVYRLQAPVDLVVLSACRTGLGKEVRGEGLIGLTRGFMYAGASSVVASLWKVDDEATAELMKYFYANMLQKGMRPAEALRAAQNTLRQDPQWASPHYWAGFTLQGEFKEPIGIPSTRTASLVVQKTVGLGLLMMLLLGIAWGYWRRRA